VGLGPAGGFFWGGTDAHRRLSPVAPPSRLDRPDPSTPVARAAALRILAADITSCRRCPRLVDWRRQVAAHPRAAFRGQTYWGKPVSGFGDPAASVVVVGLAPAAHGANRTGRMFTGDRSGDWLIAAMFRAGYATSPASVSANDGLALRGAWITAAVHCAPPGNKPSPAERHACSEYLRRELSILSAARVIVVLGQLACTEVADLYGMHPRPKFGHMAEHRLPDGRTLLCSYHPSQQNTFTGRLTEPMLDAVFTRASQLTGLRSGPGPSPSSGPGQPRARPGERDVSGGGR